MEDYRTCMEKNDSYCKVDIRLLNNGNENNQLWNLIKDSANGRHNYDRSFVHRAICLPKNETVNLESTRYFSQLHVEKEFNGTNLLALVEYVVCIEEDKVKLSLYDKLVILTFTAYMCLIVYATIKDKQKKTGVTGCTKDKVITSLSLTSNWRKICKTEGNEDYTKLKAIQGVRVFIMLNVIGSHIVFCFMITYISNTNDVEDMFNGAIMQYSSTLTTFVMQTFFLISSWIVTFQIYNIYRDHGKFTVKQAFILIINRFFRIGICLSVALHLSKPSLNRLSAVGPLTFDNIYKIQESCEHNWWQTFCFVNNYLYIADMCLPPSWYLSADYQLYIMAVITIYLILKFELCEWKVICFLILFSCMLYGSVIYVNEMDIIARININTLRRFIFTRSDPIRILYNSTYSNWTTSLVGILLGMIYTKNKNRNVTNSKFICVLWLLIFFGLPSAVIFIADYEFRGIQAAILGALVKPLFSLSVGIGILGMSHNIGGVIKRICENKYVVLMSNLSFSAYVFQFVVLFPKGVGTYSLMEFGQIKLIKYILFIDGPLSIIIALIFALIIEQPGINLQKIFLPQISRERKGQQKSQ
ncbi:O-acyltransferase like protein-like [Anoplophora glabripennis]|uniref:O-acyltransferase like protein-like n=1 Tax=Anoplophora glabripennis TaxID=217634 RepID=UPI000875357B|nr:O-acyltransferase like protein-like [Anoplophora glabripennis]